jgi:hypothetical protein
MKRTGRLARITVEPFERLRHSVAAGMDREVRDIAHFIDLAIECRIGEPAATPAPRVLRH